MIELMIAYMLLQVPGNTLPFAPTTNTLISPTYYNISSFTQLYQATNATTGGLEELFIMLLLYFVLTGGALIAGRYNVIMSALGAAIIMVPVSVLGQSVFGTSGGTIGSLMPLVFMGIAMLTGVFALLTGFLKPYE